MPRRLIRDGAETREQQEAEHQRLGEAQAKARERLTRTEQLGYGTHRGFVMADAAGC